MHDQLLVIDDSRLVRGFIESVLTDAGYVVTTACNGEEGLALAVAHPPDAVLCDLEMPGFSGFEVVSALKQTQPLLPVIILTENTELAIAVEAMQRGAWGYLTKGTADHIVVDEVRRAVKGRRVLERNQKLEAASHAQEEQLAALGKVMASVVHELNCPLAVIKANAKFLEEELPSLLSGADAAQAAEATSAVGELEACALRMHRIVDGMRQLVHRGPSASSCDFDAALTESQLICKARVPSTVAVSFDTGGLPAQVALSHDDQVMILSNLVVNAAQAVESTGKPGTVKVRTQRLNGALSLEVEDTGCGISPENLARVCEPFFTTKPRGVGTGLGLALIQQVLKRVGGELSIDSEVGRGTCFHLRVPLAA